MKIYCPKCKTPGAILRVRSTTKFIVDQEGDAQNAEIDEVTRDDDAQCQNPQCRYVGIITEFKHLAD